MALLTKEDLKLELDEYDIENEELYEAYCVAVENLFGFMTGRTIEQTALTEYYNVDDYCDTILLKSWPVATSPAVIVHDDPDWSWGDSSLVAAGDYRVDYISGIIYCQYWFMVGKQSLKVQYTAGYTSANFPDRMRKVWARQAAHWHKQGKEARWDKSSIALPQGAGTESFKNLVDNLLPDFAMLAQIESR